MLKINLIERGRIIVLGIQFNKELLRKAQVVKKGSQFLAHLLLLELFLLGDIK